MVEARRWLARVGAAFVVTLPGAARAESNEAFRLDYVAPAECPPVRSFVHKITERSPRAHVASGVEPARTVVVRVSSHGGRFLGRLKIQDPGGSEAERALEAASCDEVVSGLALIAAVALDPTASSEAPPPEVSPPPTAPVVEPPQSVAPPPAPSAPRSEPPPTRSDDKPHSEEAPRTWQISFGIQGEIAAGLSPVLLASVPVFVEIARKPTSTLFAPAARARFERPGSGTALPVGRAEFTWTEGSLDLCPIAWWPRATVRAQPCLRAEGGSVEARGSNVSPAHTDVRPWFMIGAVGGGRWTVVGPLFFEVEAALLVPIVRDRFFFQPDTTAFRASSIAFSASAGAGVSIW